MQDIKVTFSDVPYDFSGWVIEKCERILLGLCITLRDLPEIVNNDGFQDTLDNALKMYALSHGNLNGIRCDLTHALLVRHNIDGYYFLEDLLNNTKSSIIMGKIMQSERNDKILELIEANDKLNRTVLAEMLEKSDQKNLWITQLSEDLEQVHNGIKTWDWFYSKHYNDRNTFMPQFDDEFIRTVYEYFHSEAYKTADDIAIN